jgi:hypothetical protein
MALSLAGGRAGQRPATAGQASRRVAGDGAVDRQARATVTSSSFALAWDSP